MLKKLSPYIILTLIAIMVFAGGLFTSKSIISGDNRPSEAVSFLNIIEGSSGNWGWNNVTMSGQPSAPLPFSLRLIAMKLFPPVFYLKFMYFISILLAGIFFYLFIKDFELSETASLFGAVAWMLTSSIITLINPGHLGKLMALSWIPLAFLFMRRAALKDLWTNYVYAGFFLGLSFLGQGYQMSLYFGALLLFYWIYLILKKRGEKKLIPYVKNNLKIILKHKAALLATGCILLLVFSVLIPSFQHQSQTRKNESGQFRKNGKQKWAWATQWSLPPAEIIDFAIPGLFGWKTGDRTHPYLGKLGRGGGLNNLKLNSENIGLTTLIFLVAALFLLWKTKDSEHRFWFWTMIVALALSLGKYLHLPYYIFYKLPFMDTIRNPNKFVKLVAFAAVILAAHGFHLVFSEKEKYISRIRSFAKGIKILAISLASISVLSLILKKVLINIIKTPKIPMGQIKNVASYYPVAFLIAAATAGIIWYVFKLLLDEKTPAPRIRIYGYLLIALVAGELWYTADHFLGYYENDLYEQDRLTSAFSANTTPSRVLFTGQNYFVDKFGYYEINSFTINRLRLAGGRLAPLSSYINNSLRNISSKYQNAYRLAASAIPRDDQQKARAAMQKLVREYSGKMNGEISRLYQSAAIATGTTHLVTMLNITNRIFSPLFHVKLPANTRAGRRMMPHGVYKIKKAQKLSMVYRYKVHPSATQAAKQLMEGSFSNTKVLHLQQKDLNEAGNPALPAPLSGTNSAASSVALREYKNNRITAEVYTSAPGLLYIPDQFHKDWKVFIDGRKGRIIPANLVGRAIPVPKGRHKVVFRFIAPAWPLNLSLLGFLLTLLVFAGDMFYRWKKQKETVSN